MPAYTLGEIMSFATKDVGRRADIDASDVSRLVNEAYFEVYYLCDPPQGEKIAVSSTTTGENKITLPSDFYAPLSAALIWSTSTATSAHSSYATLTLHDAEWMDARNPQPSGTPTDIAFYNDWLELYPSPNSAYSLQIRYRAHPTDMTSTSSVPSVSSDWRPAIVRAAKARIYEFLQDDVRAQNESLRFASLVARLETKKALTQKGDWRQFASPMYGVGGRRRV